MEEIPGRPGEFVQATLEYGVGAGIVMGMVKASARTLLAGGRTLGLCTSLAAATALRDALKDALDVKVLSPDDLPRAKLMEEFAADETSCLVGSLGLWQGIDVPGPAVTLVIIDKVPFQRPDDPLL